MASIERTAYPRFKKVVSARELFEAFTPTPDEMAWATDATRTEGNLLLLVVLLKAFQRLGYFPRITEIPSPIAVHVGRRLGLDDEAALSAEATRTLERYRVGVRGTSERDPAVRTNPLVTALSCFSWSGLEATPGGIPVGSPEPSPLGVGLQSPG